MNDAELAAQVRARRERGCSPKEIARALGLRPAVVAGLVRAVAAEDAASTEQSQSVLCWVSPCWATGLSVSGHPDWPGLTAPESGPAGGLVSVLVAREPRRGRLSVCGYLLDVYCLGVKNALGPRGLRHDALPGFSSRFFGGYCAAPLAAPVEMAQHLVFGAVEYARSLGFGPHRDFAAAAAHLGHWSGPSAIRFGYHGKPFYIEGPHDDANQIMQTLGRSAGGNDLDHLVTV